jgi:hypothetical protein
VVELRHWRKAAGWSFAAIFLWLFAGAVDRTTEVEIASDGRRLHLEVAGSTLSAPIAIESLAAIEIRAMDSIDPPRARRLSVTTDRGVFSDEGLPRRFRFPKAAMTPIGDWEIDEHAGWGSVWKYDVSARGPFTVTAAFRGRFHHDLEIVLHGVPGASVAFRRGLINNDTFVRTAGGETLAVTSIDPTPAADVGALTATVLRALALGSLLVAFFALLEAASLPSPMPAAARRWRAAPLVGLLAVVAVLLSIWVARILLQGLPHLPDSVTYLLQARWLLAGDLWGAVSPLQSYLDVPYTYVVGDRWLGHYPPGWPLLLAIGSGIDAPWLVAPILGGLFIVLLYLVGRELDGPITGLLAATVGVMSPMVRVIFGSLLSHAAAATLILAGLWILLLARRLKAPPVAALAGIVIGLALGVRPLAALAAAIPLTAVVVRDLVAHRDRDARGRAFGWAVGAVFAALPTLAVNQIITGNPFYFPYSLAEGSIYRGANLPFGIRNIDVILYSAGSSLHGWGWPWFHGPFWVALAFAMALVPFLLRRHRMTDVLLAAMVAVSCLALLGSRGHGLHGFGPRYLFEALAPLFLLTARGFVELARSDRREGATERRMPVVASILLVVTLCGSAALALPQRLALYRGYNGIDDALERQVATQKLERAMILLPTHDWRGWAMAARMMRPDPEADLLFIQASPGDPAIESLAGNRPIFAWREGRLFSVEDDPVMRNQ